jgi:hypothetical protein
LVRVEFRRARATGQRSLEPVRNKSEFGSERKMNKSTLSQQIIF